MKYIVLIAFLFLGVHAQAQNGWVRKANSFYTQLSVSTFRSNEYYSTEGVLFNGGSTFNSRGLLFYGEYGLNDRFTAVLDLPVLVLHNFNTTETVAGLGNAKLGLKYGLLKSFPLSLAVDVEIPTDNGINFATTKEPNGIGEFEQINLATSDGELNVWTTLAASQSTKNGKTYASVFGSFNFRTKSFSHQFQSGLEAGHLFFDKLYLIGKLKIQGRLTENPGQSASFLFGEGTTFTSYGLTTMYKLDAHLRLIASYSDFTDLISSKRNIYDGATISVGVALEY
ncbi:MAG: hypothetical protein AAF206_15525 [Bacteroidota bacterium]